ncbi:MAG: DUF2268 domain-containing putative Zn-dependent protease, partial [Chitinophagaceae bacterium]
MCLIFFFFNLTTKAQKNNYKIITQDALNFWQAYDSLKPGMDTIAIFQKFVIDRASKEFKIFIKQWNITSKNYALQVKAYPKFYASIKNNSIALCMNENKIRELVKDLNKLYPNFTPANICIGLGNFSTGGTISTSSKDICVYIGLEYHSLDSLAVISELNSNTRGYVSRSNFYRTVIHELVHVQQHTHGKKVIKSYYGEALASAILREGIPEFIAELIYPYGENGDHFSYGLQHEPELKEKLKKELWQKDKIFWIYNSASNTTIPKDLGYFMGYSIAKQYFLNNNADDDAIKDIIEIKDIKRFIEKSGIPAAWT